MMEEYNGLLVMTLVELMHGLGGSEAIAGISAGDGSNFIVIPEFRSPCILNIDTTSNVGIPGVWMFKVGTGIMLITVICIDVHIYTLMYLIVGIDKENYGFQRNRKRLGKQPYNNISFEYKP